MMRDLCTVSPFVLAVGCDRAPQPGADTTPTNPPKSVGTSVPVIPNGFDQQLLDILRCPENLTVVCLPMREETDTANEQIRAGTLKTWAEWPVLKPVEAMLEQDRTGASYRVVRYRTRGPRHRSPCRTGRTRRR